METLRAIFGAGPDSGFKAQEVFANRVQELEAFRSAARMMSASDGAPPVAPVTAMGAARHNVIVYYGLGGIGKTALSKRIERRLLDGEFDEVPSDRAVARIDFGEAGSLDLEMFLLRVRASFSPLKVRWPAFDIPFSLYWERAHPGDPLTEFLRRGSVVGRAADRFGVGEQLQDTMADICREVGLAWAPARIGARALGALYSGIRQARAFQRLRADCPFFEPLVSAEPTLEMLSYFPSLLAWELEQLQGDHDAFACVLLDTFEAISRRESRDIERQVQRAVFLMPNVLFAVTGRNRLDWSEADPASGLDYVGEVRWPLLHFHNQTSEPRQHLIGRLSELDCHEYLSHVLSRGDGSPVLSPEIRARIVQGSDGLPLYLDLSVARFLELAALGRIAVPDDFGGPLASVVSAIMRDLSTEERNLLRGVSLLDSFDMDLARAAGGPVSDAVLTRFFERAFVETSVNLSWPHTLHRLLRDTVRETDAAQSDAWSLREWRLAAQRVCDHLGKRAHAARVARDRVLVGHCVSHGVRIAVEYGLWLPWAVEAAQFVADAGSWDILDIRLPDRAVQGPGATPALVEGLRGIALRRMGSLDDSLAAFDRALTSRHLDDDARALLTLHRLHSLRNSGRYDEAEPAYAALLREGGPYASRARIQLGDLSLLRGRFQSALDILQSSEDPDMEGEILRIRGHVHRFSADFDAAELLYRRALSLAERYRSPGLEGKARTNLAETLAWLNPQLGVELADEAIAFNESLHNQLEVLKGYAAKAVAAAAAGDGRESEAAVEEAMRLVETTRYRAGEVFAMAARAFRAILSGDRDVATSTVRRICGLTDELRVYRFWCEICDWWLQATGAEPAAGTGPAEEADWLGSRGSARGRWNSVLLQRMEATS